MKEKIINYIPINEQEENDKKLILNFIDHFDDVLTRENMIGHFTTSAFVVNEDYSKVLMIYHNIYNSWAWIGGHADGISDLESVIKREINEETGLVNYTKVGDILGLSVLTVDPHYKRGKYISSHLHLDIEYLFVAKEEDDIRIKEDENSGIKWVNIDEVVNLTNEIKMKPIYQKLIDKIKKIKSELI